MACIKAPIPTPPELPLPLTVKPPSLNATFDPNLCCKTPPIPPVAINPKIPPLVLDPATVILKKATKQITAYLDKLQLKCPRE